MSDNEPKLRMERDREEAAQRRREELELALADWRFVMSDERGRRAVNWLLNAGGLWSDLAQSGGAIYQAAGRRTLSLELYLLLKRNAPQLVYLMEEEARRREGNA